MSLELVKFKQLHPGARLPTRSYDSAGYDLYSVALSFILSPGETILVNLGIAAEFSPSYVVLFRDRSSMGKAGITVFGGVIDADYRGEWRVTLHNANRPAGWLRRFLAWLDGKPAPGALVIHQGDKIAQALFLPIGRLECQWCQELMPTVRGQSGYGSSGGSPTERLNHVP
jgi:dUTP pyrophosphatase